jgi:Family of unknown function (DUF5991)
MKILLKFGVFCASFLLFAALAQAQTDWVGVYEFGEDGGKTTGGSAISISHQIEIRDTDNGFLATIISDGYQTARDLVCTVKTDGDKIAFYFDSYGENNSLEPYAEGDLLLTLERKTIKNKTEILTFWSKFKPVIANNETTGKVYFKKIEVKNTKN